MPYHIEHRGESSRPWKIVRSDDGKTVGSSTSRASAQSSINARMAGEHGWRPKGRG